MDRLTYLQNFLKVLDLGSFSAAARVSQISQPAVSQQIATLEKLYDAPLLQRSASGVRPTRAGEIVARHAENLIENHRQLQAELDALSTTTRGEIRISLSQFMGQSPVAEAVQALGPQHPDLKILMKIEDRRVDVVKEGYDLALRTGDLGQTDGIARKIARMENIIVASKSYLDRAGRPKDHNDLQKLSHIQYNEHRNRGFLSLRKDGQDFQAPVVTGMIVESPNLFIDAVVKGYGFARVPVAMNGLLKDLTEMEVILPDYEVDKKEVYLVYPHRHALNQNARVVAQAILQGLSKLHATDILPCKELSP